MPTNFLGVNNMASWWYWRDNIGFLVLYIVDIISKGFLYSWYFINRFSFAYGWYFINRFVFLDLWQTAWYLTVQNGQWKEYKGCGICSKLIILRSGKFIVTLIKCSFYWLWADFRPWSSISIINFGQVNTCWDVYINDDTSEMKYWVALLKTYETMKEKWFGILNYPNFTGMDFQKTWKLQYFWNLRKK